MADDSEKKESVTGGIGELEKEPRVDLLHKLLILQCVAFTFCLFCAFLRLYQE
jgi:hypothetical protein